MAKIKEDDIDRLRETADIVDVISAYSPLKKSGGHTFKGLCPFHSEKTPSFTVDVSRNLWHCFGCQEGGNIFHFVQKAENLPFPEAVEWLARKSGIELHYEEQGPGEKRAHGLKTRLLDANNEAARFFHETLMTSPAAGPARDYLQSRGFGREVAERWQLGYSPGGDKLFKHLVGKGFSQGELEQAVLVRRSDRDGSVYDFFRNRIMFPTWNLQTDVVGFGARAMGDQQPKYLNTSETPVFSKSRVMYGLNRAKSAIARGSALVVEGYTDVISLHEAGITEAVATNGVALGETHFELLKKFSSRAVLMFDADEAGKGATERGFGIHHRIGIEVLVAPLPAGRDPAEVVRDDGPEGIKKVIDTAQPLLEFKLEQTLAKLRLDTPEARARAVREAVGVLGWHPDPIARHQYLFMVAQRIGVEPEAVQRAFSEKRSWTSNGGGESGDGVRDRRVPGHIKVEREALRLMIAGGASVLSLAEGIDEMNFTGPTRRELFAKALQMLRSEARLSHSSLADKLSDDALSLYTELSVSDVDDVDRDIPERAREVFGRLRVFALEREIKGRRNTLQELNPLVDAEKHDALFTELVRLEAERRDLLRNLQGVV